MTLAGTAGATTATVTGSGTTYNVAVSGMTGSGTVIATIAAAKATDAAGNNNTASSGGDNTVTYDVTAPTVSIIQAAAQADPTSTSPINFTATFSETVTGFATGDVTLSGTAGATTATVTGSGTTYNVAVSGMTGSGTVIATIAAAKATDAAGNNNTASSGGDNTVTYNKPAGGVPTVSAVSPNSGLKAGGLSVTITGTNFAAGATVKFGNNSATNVVVVGATSITCTSPAGTGTVHVTVTTSGGTSATSANDMFMYGDAPTVTGVSPNSGSRLGYQTVTITGTGFATANTVLFGTTEDIHGDLIDDSTLVVITPPHALGKVDVTVTNAYGTSSAAGTANDFTFADPVAPVVTAVTPSHGSIDGGETLTITGTSFMGATDIYFGDTPVTWGYVDTDTSIVVHAPAHAAGKVDVTVVAPGGTSSTSGTGNDYTYGSVSYGTQISGKVEGAGESGTVVLSGATVTVKLNAGDANYDTNTPANNLVGTAIADVNGNYTLNVSTFRTFGLIVGSLVDVTASAPDYLSVTQYGAFDQASIVVSFRNFYSLIGHQWEDRRLPLDTGQTPPPPFEYLLPHYAGGEPLTVTINQAGAQADPTNASPINFTVVFSAVVTDFATG